MLRTIVDLLKILFCFEDPLYVVKIDGHYWRYNPKMPKSLLSRTPYLDEASKVSVKRAAELKRVAEINGYSVKVIRLTWWMMLAYGISH